VPKAREKNAMYELGNQLLEEMGFVSIGMDHFALPTDKLLKVYTEGNLHRNFMGYTTTNHKLVIGLGASSISDTWTSFAQNEKTVESYQEKIDAGEFPLINGHRLSDQDLLIRRHILELMCQDRTRLNAADFEEGMWDHIKRRLKALGDDDLIRFEDNVIQVLPKGRLFIRNICSSLDAYLFKNDKEQNVFSRAI
ncbi:MAG: coproporphyrinogen III oxidase, partial [Saprospiraceae bacterium]|nr:coproporphyrinogen III oxidase [Saprospiraceae bacterium]